MTTTTEVATTDLTGDALDYAVALIENPNGLCCFVSVDGGAATRGNLPHYSTDWAQCGPLRDKYRVAVYNSHKNDGGVVAFFGYECGYMDTDISDDDAVFGQTAPVAICRAIVSAKIGRTVLVPAVVTNLKSRG